MISLQKEIQQLDSLQHKIHKLDTLDTPNWTATIPLNTSDISEKLQQIDPIKICTFMHQIQNKGTGTNKMEVLNLRRQNALTTKAMKCNTTLNT